MRGWALGLARISICAVLVVVGGGATAEAAPTEVADPRAAYVQRSLGEDPPPQLLVVEADGTTSQVSPPGVETGRPAWSPSGDLLAYVTVGAEGPEDLVVTDTEDGNSATRARASAYEVAWSPDGESVAFTDTDGGLAIADVEGGGVRVLTQPSPALDLVGSFAPDGLGLVLLRLTDGEFTGVVVVVDALTGAETLVRSTGQARAPAWSPDCARISFLEDVGASGQRERRLRTVLPDGSGERTLLTGLIASADWAPDGLSLAGVRQNGFLDSDVVVVDATTAAERVVVDGGGGEAGFGDVTWAADASRLAFTGSGEGESSIFTVAASGGDVTREVTSTGLRPVSAPAGVERLAGPNRLSTAAAVSREVAPDPVGTVVVARADDYADALAAAPLAASLRAPVLLTQRDRLSPEAAAEVSRLTPSRAVLLGGPAALSPQVDDDLRRGGVEAVERVAGADRFATAAAVADRLGDGPAHLVQGRDADPAQGWPDAVAVSASASAAGSPILLTDTTALPTATRDALAGRPAVTIVGGPDAVSTEVEREARAVVADVDRLAGATRYETSAEVNRAALAAGIDRSRPWLVTGTDYPDALVAGAAAGAQGELLLLVDGAATALGEPAREILGASSPSDAVVVGGLAAIGPRVASDAGARTRPR